jgi:hypothetical protein
MAARYTESHNDMLGKVQSAAAGGTAWNYPVVIVNTPFVGGALRNNSTDMVQVTIQVPHTRKLGSVLDSIHIHYVLQAASTLNQTIVFTGRYVWIQPGTDVPATASWTAMSGAGLTLNLGAAKNAGYYGIHSVQEAIAAPANEGYGGMLLIEITRGNGTYAGELFILDIDAHTIIDRKGSVNEASD